MRWFSKKGSKAVPDHMDETELIYEAKLSDDPVYAYACLTKAETLAPDKTKHVINLYFKVKRESGELALGDDSVLSDLKFFTLEEMDKIKIYPNVNGILKKIMKKESYENFLGMIWDK